MHSLTKLDSLRWSSDTAFLIRLRIRRVDPSFAQRFSESSADPGKSFLKVNPRDITFWKKAKLVAGDHSFSEGFRAEDPLGGLRSEDDRGWLHLNSRFDGLPRGSMSRQKLKMDLYIYRHCKQDCSNITAGANDGNLRDIRSVDQPKSKLWTLWRWEEKSLQICIPRLHHLTIRGSSKAWRRVKRVLLLQKPSWTKLKRQPIK